MDILFLSNVLPYPLDAGPKVRSYYVLRYLAQFHRVTLVAHTRAQDADAAIQHLRSFCHAVYPVPITRSRAQDARHLAESFLRNKSFLILRDENAALRAQIAKLTDTQNFDAVHADQLSTAHYAVDLKNMRRILDQHNAVWTIVERMARNQKFLLARALFRREARLVRQHEAAMSRAFDQVITVTDQDRRALETDAAPRAPLLTIPICIDPREITPLERAANAQHLACVGGMFYPPNVDGVSWFAREVMPRVWTTHPHTKFFIIGARPARALLDLAQREQRIVVTGYVADTSALLAQSAAFVVPLRAGGGMRVKILDAWARGLPIVTTTIGCEGIVVRHQENILVADTADDFSTAVVQLLNDRTFADRIGAAGRAWVQAEYDWHTIYRAFDSVYAQDAAK